MYWPVWWANPLSDSEDGDLSSDLEYTEDGIFNVLNMEIHTNKRCSEYIDLEYKSSISLQTA